MPNNADLTRRAAALVRSHVHSNLTQLLGLLAGSDYGHGADDLGSLLDQADELAAPVLDYESAAREAGWTREDTSAGFWFEQQDRKASGGLAVQHCYANWARLCAAEDIEPHELEVYEHWAVSTWLAEKLTEKGERVDTDFAGLNVWARATGRPSITADPVILALAADKGLAADPHLSALRAIKARIDGEWDQPDLQDFGPLGTTVDDISHIVTTAIGDRPREPGARDHDVPAATPTHIAEVVDQLLTALKAARADLYVCCQELGRDPAANPNITAADAAILAQEKAGRPTP